MFAAQSHDHAYRGPGSPSTRSLAFTPPATLLPGSRSGSAAPQPRHMHAEDAITTPRCQTLGRAKDTRHCGDLHAVACRTGTLRRRLHSCVVGMPEPTVPRALRYTQAVAKTLAASPMLAPLGTNGAIDNYLEFATTKDEESMMSDERTGSVTGLSGRASGLTLSAIPAVDGVPSDMPTFLAMPPPSDPGAAGHDSPEDEFLPATSMGETDSDASTALRAAPAAPLPAPAGPAMRLADDPPAAPATDSSPFRLADQPGSGGFAEQLPAGEAPGPVPPNDSMGSVGNTKRLPMPVMSISRIPRSSGPANSTEAALQGPGSVPYPDVPSDANMYVPSDEEGSPSPPRGSSPVVDRVKPRPVHAQPPTPGKPPLVPSPLPVPTMSEGASWSPPPAVATRSVHAVTRPSDTGGAPASPTSSIGNFSMYSRTGYTRSIHAMPKSGEDSMMGVPPSPGGRSVSASVASSVRRMRTSLHVMPKRGAGCAEAGPFGPPLRERYGADPPHETAPL